MGLSQVDKQQQITTVQVLTELLSGLQNLDKQTLADLAKDAYALPEAEQKKADEARANIKEYQDLVAQNKQATIDLQAEQDDIDKRSGELKQALDMLNSKQTALDKQAASLNDQDKSLTQRTVALDAREAKLTKGEATLAQGQADLAAAQDQLAQDQEALRTKSDQVRALLG